MGLCPSSWTLDSQSTFWNSIVFSEQDKTHFYQLVSKLSLKHLWWYDWMTLLKTNASRAQFYSCTRYKQRSQGEACVFVKKITTVVRQRNLEFLWSRKLGIHIQASQVPIKLLAVISTTITRNKRTFICIQSPIL